MRKEAKITLRFFFSYLLDVSSSKYYIQDFPRDGNGLKGTIVDEYMFFEQPSWGSIYVRIYTEREAVYMTAKAVGDNKRDQKLN